MTKTSKFYSNSYNSLFFCTFAQLRNPSCKQIMTGMRNQTESFRQWDKASISWLYDEYYRILVTMSFRMTKSLEESEDIVQELFTRILEDQLTFENEAHIRSFLYSSVRNLTINYLRHHQVRLNHEEYIKSHSSPTNENDDSFQKEELYRQLYRYIDALPKSQRDVFVLAMQGKKNNEIAEQLNISVNTVKTLKARGKKTLRDEMSPNVYLLLCLLVPFT